MTAIQSLYDCGAVLAERFDSIEDWERRLGTVSGSPGYCKSPLGGRGMTGGSGVVLDFGKKNKINYTAKSVVMWVTLPAYNGTTRTLYTNGYYTNPYGDSFYVDSDANNIRISIKNSTGTGAYNAASFTPGYNTIGYSWDGSNVYYYLNGSISGGADALMGTLSCSTAFQIGRTETPINNLYKIHAIAIFDRALTATEMLDLAKGQPFDRISRSLVSEWRPGAGPTIPDTGWKNLGNNGTATDVTAVQTPFGAGGRFNGSTSQINMGVGSGLDVSASNFSIEVITKIPSSGNLEAIAGKLYFSNDEYGIYINNVRKIYFQVRGSGPATGTSSNDSLNVDRYYHVVGVRKDNYLYLYINGVAQNTITATSESPITTSASFYIGRRRGTGTPYNYSSDIAYAAIYNEALTPLQVRHRYNSIMARRF